MTGAPRGGIDSKSGDLCVSIDWNEYQPGVFFDELIAAPGKPRPVADTLCRHLASMGSEDLAWCKATADSAMKQRDPSTGSGPSTSFPVSCPSVNGTGLTWAFANG